MDEDLNIQTVDEALTHQVETETPEVVTETTQTPNESQEEQKEKNKDFYKVLGQKKQLEKDLAERDRKLAELEAKLSTEDYEWYDEDNVKFIEKRAEIIAEKKFTELQKKQELNQLQLKEEQAFLWLHPEAIEKLDAVKRYRDSIDTEMSLQSAWKLLAPAYWFEMEKPKPKPANMGWGGSVSKNDKPTENYEEWEKFIGKGV